MTRSDSAFLRNRVFRTSHAGWSTRSEACATQTLREHLCLQESILISRLYFVSLPTIGG